MKIERHRQGIVLDFELVTEVSGLEASDKQDFELVSVMQDFEASDNQHLEEYWGFDSEPPRCYSQFADQLAVILGDHSFVERLDIVDNSFDS